jgi:hypothetical protein
MRLAKPGKIVIVENQEFAGDKETSRSSNLTESKETLSTMRNDLFLF